MLVVQALGRAGLWLDAKERHGVEAHDLRPEDMDRVDDVAREDALSAVGWIEPVESWLAGLEVVQVDPASFFAINAHDLRAGIPAAEFLGVEDGVGGVDQPRKVTPFREGRGR